MARGERTVPAWAAGAALGWGVRDSLPGLPVVRHLVDVCVWESWRGRNYPGEGEGKLGQEKQL